MMGSLLLLFFFFSSLLLIMKMLKKMNRWLYEPILEEGEAPLPPGDLSWPILGAMPSFLWAFKFGNPQSFINSFHTRFKYTGIYKTYMFGKPTILVTTPEICKFVLMRDDIFVTGWPDSTKDLMGHKSFTSLDVEEHRRIRKLTMPAVNGHDAFKRFIPLIELYAKDSLDSMSRRGTTKFLYEMKKFTFNIIADIFMSIKPGLESEAIEREYTQLNRGVRAMAIKFPGSAYSRAMKSRKRIVMLLGEVINKRKKQIGVSKCDVLQSLLDVVDENGRHLTSEEIIDVLLMYLNAGHESSAHLITWMVIYLQQNPSILQRVKEEQEDIRQRKGHMEAITLDDYRCMKYLSKVIDETLRILNVSPMIFRKAVQNIEVNGYTIPKDWTIQLWFRAVHLDPLVYHEPTKFDPSRWDNLDPKFGTFIPFGGGSRLCPGQDLAKIEASIFMHYMALDYLIRPLDPSSPIIYLPHARPKDNYLVNVIRST